MHTPHHRTQLLRRPGVGPGTILGALGIATLALWGGPFRGEFLRADDDPAAAAPTDPPPAADDELAKSDPADLIRRARERLDEYTTIETDLVQTSYFDKRRFEAKGHYVQGTDLKLRLQFEIEVGRTTGTLLEVCDGNELWTQYQIGDETRVTVRNVRRILEVAQRDGLSGERLMVAELGLGGLPAMLAAIERATTFDKLEVETVGGTKLYVLQGGWSEESKQKLLAGAGGNAALESYVPDRVHVYLDEQLFPRLIKYLRNDEGNVQRKLVSLELRDTKLNGSVDESQFTFKMPKGVYLTDVTGEYIQKLQGVPATAPAAPPQ